MTRRPNPTRGSRAGRINQVAGTINNQREVRPAFRDTERSDHTVPLTAIPCLIQVLGSNKEKSISRHIIGVKLAAGDGFHSRLQFDEGLL
jgi:hypothetical protein